MQSTALPDQTAVKRISRKRRFAFLTAIYLVFVLLLVSAEIVVRLALPPVSSLDLFVSTVQQKAQITNAQQSAIFEGDSWLLWRLKPNLRETVWDFTVVSTNAEHYRSDYPVGKKAPGVFRIVCIGDSVTFGYRVPPVWPERPNDYDRSWVPYPMLLERQLRKANPGRKIEVITMAVPGYTSHQGLAWLRRQIDYLQPDLVTASFGWNDVSFSDAPDRETIRTDWYVVMTRWLIDHSQAFAHLTKKLRTGNEKAAVPVAKPQPRVSEQEYLTNMLAMTQLAAERKIKTVVIAAPYRDQVTNPPEAQLMNRYRDSLRTLTERNQIPFMELLELTPAAYPSNEGWFGELIHPNHLGHRLMASELLKLYERNQLLPGFTIPTLTP